MSLVKRAARRTGGRARALWRTMANGIAAAGRRRLWAVDGPVGPLAGRAAAAVTHLGGWLRDWPDLPLWRVAGDDGLILYVGERRRLEVLAPLLGHRPEQVSSAGRVPLPGLGGRVARWRDDGVPLVICELARHQPLAPHGAGCVAVHEWVDLRLAIERPVEELLSGPRFRGIRPRLNRARRDGITWRLSRDPADLRRFHDTMYVPTVRARHGERAQLTPYRTQRDWWFRRHGLLLVERDGTPIGGSLLHLKGDAAYGVESGVVDGDDRLYQQGLSSVLIHACLLWGREQGAAVLDMGGSRPWFADGSLQFKLGWGAAVAVRPFPGREWTFCFGDLSPALAARINDAGLLAETPSGHRRVVLGDADEVVGATAHPAFAPGVSGLLPVPLCRPARVTEYGKPTEQLHWTKGGSVERQNRPSRAHTAGQSVP